MILNHSLNCKVSSIHMFFLLGILDLSLRNLILNADDVELTCCRLHLWHVAKVNCIYGYCLPVRGTHTFLESGLAYLLIFDNIRDTRKLNCWSRVGSKTEKKKTPGLGAKMLQLSFS